MSRIFIFMIRIYQETLSPLLGHSCKYVPTCSEYTIQAIRKYGAVRGLWIGIKRICRCNPVSKGGFDAVP